MNRRNIITIPYIIVGIFIMFFAYMIYKFFIKTIVNDVQKKHHPEPRVGDGENENMFYETCSAIATTVLKN